ncbi:MAG TPA: hypothetical protein PKZ42_04130 [Syntrophales bacterium]|nr:hypothetical protein [Syntrophales bacterium]
MHKKLTIVIVITFVLGLLVVPAIAKGPSSQAGKSNIGHLYLYEKDADWEIVEGGAWGKTKYDLSGSTFDFVFNGHDLPIGQEYTLIYYPDPWPGTGLICLGSGTVNEYGDIHIKESVDTGDLPIETDENDGAKIWLVLSDDVNCSEELCEMVAWNPTAYLFEYDLITFDASEEEEEYIPLEEDTKVKGNSKEKKDKK